MSVKIGVALGGGGARGLAHAGVLKVLEEEGIPIHFIAGSSMGAIIGSMYAQNPDADLLIQRIKESLGDEEFYNEVGINYLKLDEAREGSFLHQATQYITRRIVLNLAQSRSALLKEDRLTNAVSKFIDTGNIEDTKIPLGIVATSLHTGDKVVFRKGDIITAVIASSSVPGFFSPVLVEDDLLTDGAVSSPVPVDVASDMGADLTIGVEVCIREFNPLERVNIIDVVSRAQLIQSRELSRMMVKTGDIPIRPDTGDVYWSDFERYGELVEAGIISAREHLPQIKSAIRRRLPWYRKVFPVRALHSSSG